MLWYLIGWPVVSVALGFGVGKFLHAGKAGEDTTAEEVLEAYDRARAAYNEAATKRDTRKMHALFPTLERANAERLKAGL